MPIELSRTREFHMSHCLGRGGFGEVYRAVMVSHSGLKTDVAVKVLRLDVSENSQAVQRLRDEGKLLAAINHPAILRVFDLALLDGRVALVTEYVEGDDLLGCIDPKDPSPMPARALLETIGAVAEALHTAYATPDENGQALSLVHRDIKPSNIRLSKHGEVKLLDFGIAWSQKADREAKTSTRVAVGSLAYMAPERFSRLPVTNASDIYALGCTLFEGFHGDGLFLGSVPVEMYQRAADRGIHDEYLDEMFAKLPDDVHDGVLKLMRDMLAHPVGERPTAHDVAHRCEELADEIGGPSLKRWCRDRRWPTPEEMQGVFDGKVIREMTMPTSELVLPATGEIPLQPRREATTSSETFALDTGEIRDAMTSADMGATTGSETFALDVDADMAESIEQELLPPVTTTSSTLPPPTEVHPRSNNTVALVGAAGLVALLAVGGVGYVATRPAPEPPAKDMVEAPKLTSSAKTSKKKVVTLGVQGKSKKAEVEPAKADKAETSKVKTKTKTKKRVRPNPTPTPTPEPDPEPVQAVEVPEPEPVVAPEPAPVTFGKVRSLGGSAPFELRGGGKRFGSGKVPTGEYVVYADFGNGLSATPLTVDVKENQTVAIKCNELNYKCAVE